MIALTYTPVPEPAHALLAATGAAVIEKAVKDKDTFGTYPLRPELKNLRPSTLFIWGDKDKLGSPALGEGLARLAPKARCEVLRDAVISRGWISRKNAIGWFVSS